MIASFTRITPPDNSGQDVLDLCIQFNTLVDEMETAFAVVKGSDGQTASLSSNLDLAGNRLTNSSSPQTSSDLTTVSTLQQKSVYKGRARAFCANTITSNSARRATSLITRKQLEDNIAYAIEEGGVSLIWHEVEFTASGVWTFVEGTVQVAALVVGAGGGGGTGPLNGGGGGGGGGGALGFFPSLPVSGDLTITIGVGGGSGATGGTTTIYQAALPILSVLGGAAGGAGSGSGDGGTGGAGGTLTSKSVAGGTGAVSNTTAATAGGTGYLLDMTGGGGGGGASGTKASAAGGSCKGILMSSASASGGGGGAMGGGGGGASYGSGANGGTYNSIGFSAAANTGGGGGGGGGYYGGSYAGGAGGSGYVKLWYLSPVV